MRVMRPRFMLVITMASDKREFAEEWAINDCIYVVGNVRGVVIFLCEDACFSLELRFHMTK